MKLIYGNSNDGTKPDDRRDTLALMNIDGAEEEISFSNTIKSEYTDKKTFTRYLEKGSHTISL